MKTLKTHKLNSKVISEAEVISRILTGEKELYEILVRRNNQKLYRVLRSYTPDEVEIEDIMQNCYLKAYTHLHQFNRNSRFSTWLIRIGINEAMAAFKKKGRVLHLVHRDSASSDSILHNIPDQKRLNPQEKMVQEETKKLLETAVDQLDQKYRTVYIMKEVEGMQLKEIAETLDISLSNVKVRLHRSKDMLKETLYRLSNNTDIFKFGFERCDQITLRVMEQLPAF